MNRAYTLARNSAALRGALYEKIKVLSRPSLCATSLAVHARCMGSHGPPSHWKPMKQVFMESKSHMDFMPVPEGSWKESYNKQQQKWNLMLGASILAFGATYFYLYKSGVIYFHTYNYKNYSVGGSGFGVSASAPEDIKIDSVFKTTKDEPKDESAPPPPSGENPEEIDWSKMPEVPTHAQYLLIGAGTSTFGAFRAIKSRDPKAKILVIGEEESVPYMRPPLSKELWFNDNKEEVETLSFRQWNGKKRSIFYEPQEFFAEPKKLNSLEKGGIALLMGKKVVKLDAGKKTAWLAGGEKITYDKCLIATGGSPKSLPVLSKASAEVRDRTVLFRNIQDFKRLDAMTREADSVAIIGGGFLGSELACALGKRAKQTGLKVYQLYPESGNMGRVLPEYLSKWTTRKVEREGAIVMPNQTVNSADFKDGKVVLCTKEGESLSVDVVVAAVGLDPNTDLARASNLETDPVHGGFLVNAELESRRDLWVAGDAACFYDIKLGRRRVEHHDHAVVSGRLAGENMTGAAKPYWHQSMFWSDLGPDVGYEAIGIVDSTLRTVAVFAKASDSDTPKAVVEATGESLRSETEEAAVQAAVSGLQRRSPLDNEDYGKGVVFYLNDKNTVVGMLLWNTFNKMSIARQVLKDGARNEDLYEVAKLFDIYDTAVEAEESKQEAS